MKTKSKLSLLALALGITFAAYSPAQAVTTYFTDDFANLNNWAGPGGEILSDPTYGTVLSFTSLDSGGQLYTPSFNAPVGSYANFFYKGVGGFIADAYANWQAGQDSFFGGNPNQTLLYDGQWHEYSIYLPDGGEVGLEDYSGTAGAGPGTALFADLTVTDSPIYTNQAAAPATAPDGGTTCFLLGGAMTALGLLRRKFRAN